MGILEKKIRLLIVDDHPLFREGISVLLKGVEDVEVVGTARNGEEGIMLAGTLKPDIVLMDLDMPKMDGVTATRILTERHPVIKALVLSASEENQYIYAALKAGAVGYILKRTTRTELLKTLRSAYEGTIRYSPFLANQALKEFDTPLPGEKSPLLMSGREKEVLTMIAEGYGNKAIADKLCMSRETVKAHLKHIFEKLQVKNRTQAAMTAMKQGFLAPADAADSVKKKYPFGG